MLRGQRPGDRRVRVEMTKPPPAPAVVFILGFALLIAVGTVVLTLPVSSATGTWTSIIDAMFTATSAVCVTGFVVLDTATHWGGFGQLIIFALSQIGGFGFMTGSTLLLYLLVGRRSGLRDRVLAQESTGAPNLGSVTSLIRRVAVFTLICEGVGAVVLTAAFLARSRDL